MPEPSVPVIPLMEDLIRLKLEKEAIGFYLSGHPLDMYNLEMNSLIKFRIKDLKEAEINKGKEIAIGAMVTSVNHRISKNGKPFGSFVIEDYDEAHELVLFGEDYLKFKIWLNPGEFLFIRGKIQDRYKQPGNLEFRISNIQLLSDLRDKMVKYLTLKISVDKINAEWIKNVQAAINQDGEVSRGNCVLKIKIYDPVDEKIFVDLPSKNLRINPHNDLIDSLKQLAEIEF